MCQTCQCRMIETLHCTFWINAFAFIQATNSPTPVPPPLLIQNLSRLPNPSAYHHCPFSQSLIIAWWLFSSACHRRNLMALNPSVKTRHSRVLTHLYVSTVMQGASFKVFSAHKWSRFARIRLC